MNIVKTVMIKVLQRILPNRIKNSIFHLSFHLAHAEYEKFAYHYNFSPNMDLGLADMAARGFFPRTIVDVGAFEGNWSKLAKRIWPSGRLFMIEPNLEKKEWLLKIAKDLDASLFCELLGAEDGREVQFYVMESGSSIMAERSEVPRTAESRRLRTLNSLLKDIEPPAFLKIDAQGYELLILKGASRILPDFEAVLLEVAIIEINEGAPLLHEVVAFMKTHGFVAYDILEIHRRPLDKALNQLDIVFVSEQSQLIADKRHFASSGRPSCG
jgi:FkbM family methyltransferase